MDLENAKGSPLVAKAEFKHKAPLAVSKSGTVTRVRGPLGLGREGVGTWGRGDGGTWGLKDVGTRGRGDVGLAGTFQKMENILK